MVRRSIFMPQRSRAGADASAHVGHAPRLLGRRGGIDVNKKGKETESSNENRDWYMHKIFCLLSEASQQEIIITYRFITALISKRK